MTATPSSRRGARVVGLVSLLLILATQAAAPVAAHPITTPLPVEHFLLDDEAEDAFLVIDGYDLYDLYVRETHWPEHGDGITFRFTMLGGFAANSMADEMQIELGLETPSGPWSARLVTQDDQEWTATGATLVDVEVEPDIYGYVAKLQVFVPYQELGVEIGDTLSGAWMRSLVDDEVVDIAPGGVYLIPGSPVEIPTESHRVTDAFDLQGPRGYFDTEIVPRTGGFNIEVKNLFAEDGQHVHLHPDEATAWNYDVRPLMANLDPGANVTVLFEVTESGSKPLPLHLMSDHGGHETWYLHATPDGLLASENATLPQADIANPVEEAPGAAVLALLFIALAWTWSRRQNRPACEKTGA